ncbi:STAS domain-containing protein [Planosporangium thailandense]|uniref:Anti-sigma factor antagonist n=1 Tax=Planosporangium thailandense TaxID=765197 RepID=A0ABX0YAM4_9ACTN|nr:STAS domain-containing protein [Planosporangium thailandense]NJC74299.1 STAS domain-containing protein [Planosporangium thailandense]
MASGQLSTHWLPDGNLMVDVRGELDILSSRTLRHSLSAEVIAMKPVGVLVDLGSVTFMDTTALGALIGVQRDLHRLGAELRVVNTSPSVAHLLAEAGVDGVLGCHADGPAADVPPQRRAPALTTADD